MGFNGCGVSANTCQDIVPLAEKGREKYLKLQKEYLELKKKYGGQNG